MGKKQKQKRNLIFWRMCAAKKLAITDVSLLHWNKREKLIWWNIQVSETCFCDDKAPFCFLVSRYIYSFSNGVTRLYFLSLFKKVKGSFGVAVIIKELCLYLKWLIRLA